MMKCFLLFLGVLAATSAMPSSHQHLTKRLGNSLDDLIKEALEVVRKQMKTHDPLTLPPIPTQVIDDDDTQVHLKVTISDATVSKASDFVVNDIETNMVALSGKFGVTNPTAVLAGNYQASGTVQGKTVSGQGTFTASITQLVVNGNIQLENADSSTLQIKDLQISYTVQDLKFTETGLSVEGMTQEQLEQFFSMQLLKFLQDQEAVVSQKIARQIIIEGNQLIKGKTLQDIIDWLKKFIDSSV